MRRFLLLALLGLTAGAAGPARAAELNVWPFWVGHTGGDAAGPVQAWTAVGPLFFWQPVSSPAVEPAVRAGGLRPLFVQFSDAGGKTTEAYLAYPLFAYRRSPDGYRWSIFNIVNHSVTAATGGGPGRQGFDVWPFYFSRDTGDPETTYHAFLPVYGEVKYRFGQDRLKWVLFPLYVRAEKNGVSNTITPWPFVRTLRGQGNHGFTVWPLFGRQEKEGAYRKQFYLWPLGYKHETELWLPEPTVRLGVLPFYTRETSAAARSETWLWPFFGYTDRRAPFRYHEKRYFWPLFVQGRGDDRLINRWGPFYTHSVVKGVDKTWVLWPFWRKLTYEDRGLRHTKRQFAYFLYYSNEQRSAANPALPAAHKTHYWPLASVWDNGAGRRQVQAPSPLEIFFPNNEVVRQTYTPLFALYRYDRGPGQVRHSLLWNLVSYRREQTEKEFHLGPLVGIESGAAKRRRVALIAGLLGWERVPGRGTRWFAFEFRNRKAPGGAGTQAP